MYSIYISLERSYLFRLEKIDACICRLEECGVKIFPEGGRRRIRAEIQRNKEKKMENYFNSFLNVNITHFTS